MLGQSWRKRDTWSEKARMSFCRVGSEVWREKWKVEREMCPGAKSSKVCRPGKDFELYSSVMGSNRKHHSSAGVVGWSRQEGMARRDREASMGNATMLWTWITLVQELEIHFSGRTQRICYWIELGKCVRNRRFKSECKALRLEFLSGKEAVHTNGKC